MSENSLRLLLVDDSWDDRAITKEALLKGSPTRFDFREAATCSEASSILSAGEGGEFNCIILDYNLPDCDAPEFLGSLPRVEGILRWPVLVLTGSSTHKNRTVLRAGAQEYLGKGWLSPESITRAVENAMERHSTARQMALAHTKLKASEEFSRTIIESSPDCVKILDADGRLRSINESGRAMLELDDAETIQGRPWAALWPESMAGELASALEAARDGRRVRFQGQALNAKGRAKWWDVVVTPVRDDQGQITQILAVSRDVSASKLNEEQLERLVSERTAKLQETIGELESVSYSLSHDMRQPLRSMQQFSQMLLEDYAPQLDAPAQSYLHRTATAANRLDRLIQDVLTYSRISRALTHPETLDLDTLVRDIIHQYPAFNSPNATIAIKGRLAPVHASEAPMTQIISNLLGNAVKFVPADRHPTVELWTEQRGEQIRLWVADNGIGIEPGDMARIWKMFERGAAHANYEGTGIGLNIVRKAAERMNGTAGVESEPGKGSRFWVQLPKPPTASS